MHLVHRPHHDGSALYAGPIAPALGDVLRVRALVPDASAADEVHLRSVADGEPRWTAARVEATGPEGTWWVADLAVTNPITHYRFLLLGGRAGYLWLNAAGTFARDVVDHDDFRVVTHDPPPDWLADTVLYQVFPDRFARSGAPGELPDWALPAQWDDEVPADWTSAVRQIFGGDLWGLVERLPHLSALGVTAVYLTPFFPAPSAHRYNATTFDHVDPLLGGDEALAALTTAAHAVGIRVVGDLTTNHSGDQHDWFRAAQADAASDEADFYYFRSHPHDYVAWFDVPSLPKFRHGSTALRERLVTADDSTVARWLRPPFDLDGWRIDVANMTGRCGADDVNLEVARDIRRTMAEVKPDTWLVAEHCYDATADLQGDAWHGTMAYTWFTRPVWCWLRGDRRIAMMGVPGGMPPRLDGTTVAESMQALAAGVPWRSVTASMTLLDSHDTARFASLVGDRDRHLVGVAFLMAYPGVAMVFAGDEVGVTGDTSDLARAPFPWDDERWDDGLLDGFRSLIAARRSSTALRRGGLRWVHAGADSLTFLREAPDERVLVHLARAPHDPVVLDAAPLGVGDVVPPLHGAHPLVPVDGTITLPGGGPAAHYWTLGPLGPSR